MEPWGQLEWLVPKLLDRANTPVKLIGCISPEDRSTAVPTKLEFSEGLLLVVEDAPSRYSAKAARKVANNRRLLEGANVTFRSLSLFAPPADLESALAKFLRDPECLLVIDMTSLPKRFFFFLLKLTLRRKRLAGLCVTYTQPEAGGYADAPLAEDAIEPAELPGYSLQKSEPSTVIVSLGFDTLGLDALLDDFRNYREVDVKFLLPFPPGQPYSRRIWRSVFSLGNPPEGAGAARVVSAIDAFDAYRALMQIAPGNSSRFKNAPPALAPFGPKPVSLAMCLYAIKFGSPVYYTQPSVYNPDYSVGIGASWAYCLRLGNRSWP